MVSDFIVTADLEIFMAKLGEMPQNSKLPEQNFHYEAPFKIPNSTSFALINASWKLCTVAISVSQTPVMSVFLPPACTRL